MTLLAPAKEEKTLVSEDRNICKAIRIFFMSVTTYLQDTASD